MRKVLTVALVALLVFAGTGVLAVAAPDNMGKDTVEFTDEGLKVRPGENGEEDPFHEDGHSKVDGISEVTPDNPIHVGE